MAERVVLVDSQDRPLGSADKIEAHQEGWLHRAFSIFVYDPTGRLLIQKRHPDKYHSGGLWSNTCCSHPRPGESVADAARRRIAEEMGFTCSLTHSFRFSYTAGVGNDLVEREIDHVFVSRVRSADVRPHDEEVVDWCWIDPADLASDVEARPEAYTAWFRLLLRRPELSAASVSPSPVG